MEKQLFDFETSGLNHTDDIIEIGAKVLGKIQFQRTC